MYVLKLYLHIRYYNILIMLLDKNVISPNQIINFVFVLIVFFNIKNMFYTPQIPTGVDLEWKRDMYP